MPGSDDLPAHSRWLTIAILILLCVISAIAVAYISSETKAALTESTRDELASLAAISASQINGTLLDSFQEGDEVTPQFLAVRDQLFAMEQSHPDIKYIYTMRRVDDTIRFIVDAEYGLGTPGEDPVIGEVYAEATPEMFEGFMGPVAEHAFVTDEWGTTLSGYAPVRDLEGRVVGIVGVDMTAEQVTRKITFIDNLMLVFLFAVFGLLLVIGIWSEFSRGRYDEAVEARERRYHAVVDAQTEFIVRFRPDGTILFANEAYCKYYGMKCSEMTGKRMYATIPREEREVLANHFNSLTQDHPVASIEHRTVLPDGRIGWHQWTDRAFFDRGGHPVEYQSVGRDITEKKQAEEAISLGTKKLNLLNYLIFTDIRNAIFILSGYLQLQAEITAEVTTMQYREIEESLVRRIEKSLDYARDYQSLGLRPPEWQNVSYVFAYAVSHLDVDRLSRKTEVDHIEIFADPLLEKVFFHLVKNVLVHAKTATIIALTARETPSGLVLVFSDNGPGISQELKADLFLTDFSNKTFGLFLSHEILSVTGISITENGVPGSGARFELLVPPGAYRFVTEEQPSGSGPANNRDEKPGRTG